MTNLPNRPLRIAFVDYVLEPDKPGRSGLSDLVWDMGSELINQGHEAHVIASYHTDQFPDSRVIVHNFPTPPMGYRNVVGHFWLLKRAAAIARQIKPDIIHAPEYVSTAVFATLRAPTPLVLTVPGNIFQRLEMGHDYEWHFVQVLKWAAKVSARRCGRVIAISREMKDWWQRTGSDPERTIFIPLGIDPKRFYPVTDARSLLGLPQDKLILLYVGRFSREKGLLDFIDALSLLGGDLQRQLKVIFIGAGSQLNELTRRIHEHQLEQIVSVKHWVNQDELATWYSAADALVLPSHSEAFSRTIPEAMNCGTPVIGSRITGTEDHVQDGFNGFLFPAKDPRSLANILEQIIVRPRTLQEMHVTTLAYAQQKLTWACQMHRIIQDVYQPLVDSVRQDQ